MVTILGHFDRKIVRFNSSTLAPYGKRKIVILHSFLNKFSRPFDHHNNQHSPQQGVGKFDNEYAQIMCRVGCSNIKYVWKQSQMIITHEPNGICVTVVRLFTRVSLPHWIHKVVLTSWPLCLRIKLTMCDQYAYGNDNFGVFNWLSIKLEGLNNNYRQVPWKKSKKISDFLKQERLLQKAFEHNLAVFQKSVKFFKNPFCGKQFIFPLVTRENRYS